MSLMIGTGPFGESPGGTFNFDTSVLQPHTLYLEDTPKRVRTLFNGEAIADSRGVKLLHETGQLPVYYFPEADVRQDLLERSERTSQCPFKGDATYRSVRVGDRTVEDALWTYERPREGSPLSPGYFAFYWDAMDAWYEEEEHVFVHPRDPYHRIDVLRSSRHVRVLVDSEVVAETRQPRLLLETGLPIRFYIPPEDVRSSHLRRSDTRTRCPYKGEASYRSLEEDVGGVKDVAWCYHEPLHDAEQVAGYFCFFDEKVDVEVDGERQGSRGSGVEG